MLPQGESLNGRARDELLNIEEFATLTEARVSSKPGEWSTTPIGPTRRLAGSRPSNSNGGGPNNTNPHAHSGLTWTPEFGPPV
jgi:hypothetical protein